jgi:predicted Zn-dependent protease with MMP-like domain/Tfp pilus assembly protein PilF
MSKRDDLPTGPRGPDDELARLLDRGWELLRNNDFRGAEHSAEEVLAREADAPEALTLLGAVAAAEGDEEEALEQYRRAMEADPEYVSPMLFTAELLLGPEGDPDEALKLIDEALELAEEEDEYLDVLLLKAEALIACGDADDEALTVLGELPPVDLPEALYHLRAGRCFYDLDKIDEAQHHFERAMALEPEPGQEADAWHGIGLCHEARGDVEAQAGAWRKVRTLDLAEPPPPFGLDEDDFAAAAEKTLAELPPRVKKLLENVPILVELAPSVELIDDGQDPRLLGLFDGVPYPEKTHVGSAGHLDAIHLFQRNIERVCRCRDELLEEIRVTILHETAHFFGLSEEDLEAIGLD